MCTGGLARAARGLHAFHECARFDRLLSGCDSTALGATGAGAHPLKGHRRFSQWILRTSCPVSASDVVQVMQDNLSAKPSLGLFFGSIAPRLAPRFYSISSSNALHPRSVHVTCAVIREVRRRPGWCICRDVHQPTVCDRRGKAQEGISTWG
jgi:hypothetical protein